MKPELERDSMTGYVWRSPISGKVHYFSTKKELFEQAATSTYLGYRLRKLIPQVLELNLKQERALIIKNIKASDQALFKAMADDLFYYP